MNQEDFKMIFEDCSRLNLTHYNSDLFGHKPALSIIFSEFIVTCQQFIHNEDLN